MGTEWKRVFGNAASLFSLQLVTYAISLLAVPYLVRVLGPSGYGAVVFAQSAAMYFLFLVDYGFDISGTMALAEDQDNSEHVSRTFHSVMAAKLILLLAGFGVFALLVYFVPKFREEWVLFMLTFGMLGGQFMIPQWFYRGMERMKFIAYSLIAVKSGYLALVLLIVKETGDYILVPLANLIAYNVVGFLALRSVYKKFDVYFVFPSFSEVVQRLREGFTYFAKSITDNFAKVTNTLLLGFLAGDAAVGYYGAAEKLMDAVRGMLAPAFQAIFPQSKKHASRSSTDWFGFFRIMLPAASLAGLLLSLGLLIFAEQAVSLVLGADFGESVVILRILSFYLFFFSVNNLLGIQTLVCLGMGGAFLRLTLIARGAGLVLSIIMVPLLGKTGAAIALLGGEGAYTAALTLYIIKTGLITKARRGEI
ncbi:flippase [Limisalsivibrio acetivorans]|uniref:flippase n=1 Tax=Limisalsivibrio acetivorans TaxID=1304888 RepID=UPI0003B6B181|nr:flippase [Limisalsivibrio acetivorans]